MTIGRAVRTHSALASLCCLLLAAGCSDSGKSSLPEAMGQVSGTVTIGGKALPDVEVIFEPTDGSGPSKGMTDEEGHYVLHYGGGGEEGAVVGTHKVYFEHLAEDIDAEGNPLPGGESALPDKYTRDQSDITKEVTEGEQVIDFTLDGK